jgi:hypothetical protein
MDLPIIEKPLLAILMNCDNQMVIVKVDRQYEIIKTHQKTVKIYQENEKLRGYYIGLYPY